MRFPRLATLLCIAAATTVEAQTSPSATSIFPSGIGVPTDAPVLIGYCCGASPQQIDLQVRIANGGALVAGRTQLNGGWALFTPDAPWRANTQYTVSFSSYSRPATTASFTAGSGPNTTPFQVVSTVPVDGQNGVLPSDAQRVRFSTPVNPFVDASDGPVVTPVAGIFVSSFFQLISPFEFLSTYGIREFGVYRMTFTGEKLRDVYGQRLTGAPVNVLFRSYPNPRLDGPSLRRGVPANDETNVPTNQTICLEFDRTVLATDAAFTLSADGDPNVPLEILPPNLTPPPANIAALLLLRPRVLLRPNREYTLSVVRLRDQFGVSMAVGAQLLRFRTGLLPETGNVADRPMPSQFGRTDRVQWRFSRPVHPILVPRIAFSGGDPAQDATVDLEVRPTPGDPTALEVPTPLPGRYTRSSTFFDRVTAAPLPNLSAGVSFLVLGEPDTKPPSILGVFPEPDSVTATNLPITVYFDEWMPVPEDGEMRVTLDGQPVSGSFTSQFQPGEISFTPRQPLIAGRTYRVELNGWKDYAGNAAPAFEWSFTVGDVPTEPFRFTGSLPANNAADVDASSGFSFTFNRPPARTGFLRRDGGFLFTSGGGRVPGKWQVQGSTATFTPEDPVPHTQVFFELSGLVDTWGQRLQGAPFFSFSTRRPDAVPPPPRVISTRVDRDGFTLQFDQQLLTETLRLGQTFYVEPPVNSGNPRIAYDALTKTLFFPESDWGGGIPYRVRLSSSVLSIHGVGLDPYGGDFTIPSSPRFPNFSSQPIFPFQVSPWKESISAGEPLVIHFGQEVRRDLVEQGLQVEVNQRPVPGRLEWTLDGRSAVFHPASPFVGGSSGRILISFAGWGIASGWAGIINVTGGMPQIRLSTEGFDRLPQDASVDIEFPDAKPSGYVLSAVFTNGQNPPGRKEYAAAVEVRSPRVFRIRAAAPLNTDVQILEVRVQDNERPLFFSAPTTGSPTPASREVAWGPTPAMGPAPLNTLLWAAFQTNVNPVQARVRLTIEGSGTEHPVRIGWTDRGSLLTLEPLGLLRGNTVYAVELTGLEDVAGRPLADRRWTFQTGTGVDFAIPQLVSWAPNVRLSPTMPISLTMDRPMIPSVNPSNPNFEGLSDFTQVRGRVRISENGRTLTLTPDRPWPVGSLRFARCCTTWTGVPAFGNSSFAPPAFQVSADPALLAPPVLETVNPPRGSSGAPLNSRIRARFVQDILPQALSSIRLLGRNGQPEPIRPVLEADGRTVDLRPVNLLAPNQSYTVQLDGVRNVNNAPPETMQEWTFETGNMLQNGSTGVGSIVVESLQPLTLRVRLSRRADPLSLRPVNAISVSYPGVPVANEFEIESDWQTLRIRPRLQGLLNATGTVTLNGVLDWAGNQIAGSPSFNPSPSPLLQELDSDAPRVQWTIPSANATLAGLTVSSASVIYDLPIHQNMDLVVRVTSRGREYPASAIYQANRMVTVRPVLGWLPGESYEIELDGVFGLNGKPAAPARWNFTVPPNSAFRALTLVSSKPAQGAVGVPPNEPIELTFSHDVIPVSQPSSVFLIVDNSFTITSGLREEFLGSLVRLTPNPPIPGGFATDIRTMVASSTTSSGLNVFLRYTTAAPRDTTPPVLEAIDPSPGEPLRTNHSEWIARFSEPVTLRAGEGFLLTVGSSTLRLAATVQPDGRTVRIPMAGVSLLNATAVTLNLTDGIRDLSGNALVPRTLPYPISTESTFRQFRLLSVEPANTFNVPASTQVVMRFSERVNEGSLRGGLEVFEDGGLVPFQLTQDDEDGTQWRVAPSPAWKPGANIIVRVPGLLYAESGIFITGSDNLIIRLRVADAQPPIVVTGIRATPAAVDVRFSDSTPSEFTAGDWGLRLGQVRVTLASVERKGPGWLRFVPQQRLRVDGQYHLMAGPGVEFPLEWTSLSEPPVGDIRDVAQVAGGVEVRLRERLHPFAWTGLELFDTAGNRIPCSFVESADGVTLVLKPESARTRADHLVWRGRRFPIDGGTSRR